MNRDYVLSAILAAVLLTMPATAQPATAETGTTGEKPASPEPRRDSSADLEAIRAASDAFVAAFNQGDAKAVAAHWTQDGDYVDDFGRTFSGREAIEQGYAGFFTENPEARIRIVIDSLRLLSDCAAIEDGRAMVDPPPTGAPAVGKYTAVHVKVDGKWLMSTVRDTRVEMPSAYANVADLEFLIGTWTAEEHGAKTESVCRWVASKSFVERNYKVTHADGTTASGVQLIGWNPEGGHVQSWNFSSDGGHAVGVWTPTADGWSAEIRGVTGDGLPTVAVNLLTRLDDNAYFWQSVQRTAGETSLPDTDEVVLKRLPTER
jgi:uncharacterized protein (TIGR02246 family)